MASKTMEWVLEAGDLKWTSWNSWNWNIETNMDVEKVLWTSGWIRGVWKYDKFLVAVSTNHLKTGIEWISKKYVKLLFLVGQQPLVGQAFLIIEASRSHSDTPQMAEQLWTSDHPLPDNIHQSKETGIHDTGGIRTRNPNKWAGADPRLRPRGNWVRPMWSLCQII